MTSAAHRVHGWQAATAQRAGDDGSLTGAVDRHVLHAVACALALVACLAAAAILLAAVVTGIDTHGRVPHPAPLPAPTGHSLTGG